MKRFKLIFFMSLILILILGTTSCYARTTLTDEEAEYLWNYFTKDTFNNEVSNNNYNNFYYTSSSLKKYSVVNYKSFQSYFNSNNEFSIDEHTYFFALYGTNILYIYWWNFNNTISGTLPYLYLRFNNDNNSVDIYAIDDNKDPVSLKGGSLQVINFDTSSPQFSSYSTNTIGQNGKYNVFHINSKNFNVNNENYTNTFNPISGLTNFAKLPISVIYSNFDGISYYGSPKSFFYKNLFVTEADNPPQPSGDTGTGGTTGNITNPSGDTTGKIDLSGIEQGIGNINNSVNTQAENIINNQNQNTDKIISNQNQNNQEVTQRLDDINSYDKDTIDNVVQGYLSGDYNASSSILALNDAFFNSSDDGDLVIDWDGISYLGVDLIPQGSFNFTEFVSSDEQITKIYNYYKMFATASFGIILIAAYYNLALSVLGLGSYFAMNTETEEESTSDLGNSSPQLETTQEYYTRKFKHESNMRYNKRG